MHTALVLVLLCCVVSPLLAQAPPPVVATPDSAPSRPLALDDLFSAVTVADAALSPSGRYLAVIVRQPSEDRILIHDLTTGDRKYIKSVPKVSAGTAMSLSIGTVYWKSDDRLLCRLHVRPAEGKDINALPLSTLGKMGDRLFALNRNGGDLVMLLGDNREMALAGWYDLGDIASFLHQDPNHILMELDGYTGRSLFKVSLDTGKGTQIEPPLASVIGW